MPRRMNEDTFGDLDAFAGYVLFPPPPHLGAP